MLTGYIAYRAIYIPTQHELGRLHQQLAEEKTTQDLRVQLAHSLEEIQRSQQRLSPEPNTEWLLREVTKRAEEEGIQLSTIAPQDRRDLRDATQLSVILQLSAPYHRLGKFLSAIERAPSFMWIEDIQVAHGRDDVPVVRLTISTLCMQNPKI